MSEHHATPRDAAPRDAAPDEGAARAGTQAPANTPPLLRIIGGSRYLFVLAVISTFVASVILLLVGTWQAIEMAGRAIGVITVEEHVSYSTQALEIVDILLVATVLFVLSTGFYQLFLRSLPTLPHWLQTATPESMEMRLVGVVITVLAVSALVRISSWDGTSSMLDFGGTVALLIAALSFYIWAHSRSHAKH